MTKIRHLLIDADYLLYLAAFGVEKEFDWGDDLWTLHADLGEAKDAIVDRIDSIKETLKGDKISLALSCPTELGFRRKLCATYKANRTNRKPVCYRALREWFFQSNQPDHPLNAHTVRLWPRLEADDVLGILATETTDEDRIIVSVDKDYKGIPGKFYRLRPTEEPEKIISTPEEAARFHLLQTLMGDKVDGYNGIPGVGPKTAEKILEKAEGRPWDAVVAAYQKAGLTEADALLNARLAWILRAGDYNHETNKLRLWTP